MLKQSEQVTQRVTCLLRLAEHAVSENIHHEVMLALLKKEIVREALTVEDWNLSHAARRLGTHRNSLRRWITQFNLQRPAKKRPGRVA